ncbi:ImmA/IrrE family metallo-endopeptidase [Pelistega suis]|uniref:ImmA/IrrE family metallo-endopeptidase n=1 Tax=Pelistega suis TaxID=1631957 RepID=A0A849P716_9BURK|nr:ImmA/IrrE family metallo-endopeptidase [Pelistega suis]NOL51803.1 ImmA/IrrE family metallo-endopeptidase [Pelistega suis]
MIKQNHYHQGYVVNPLSISKIHSKALDFRMDYFHRIDRYGRIDISTILEIDYGDGRKYAILESDSNGPMGLTTNDGIIFLAPSVYEGAINGNGRDRFTLAHEFGHVCLHQGQIGFARASTSQNKIYENSEWQANEFAGAVLLPDYELVKNKGASIQILAEQFGVSLECAEIRKEKAQRRGIL